MMKMRQSQSILQIMKAIRSRVGFYHIYNLVDRAESLEVERNVMQKKDRYKFDGTKKQFDALNM